MAFNECPIAVGLLAPFIFVLTFFAGWRLFAFALKSLLDFIPLRVPIIFEALTDILLQGFAVEFELQIIH